MLKDHLSTCGSRFFSAALNCPTIILSATLLLAAPAFAQQAGPGTQVGDTVTNPLTGVDSVVIELLGDRVLTDSGDVFFLFTMVGDVLTDPADPMVTAAIASVNVNMTTNLVDQVTLDTGTVIDVAQNVSQNLSDADAAAQGDPGNPGGPVPVSIPTGNNIFPPMKATGPRGSDGRDGYGVEVCIPFVGCAIIGRSPHAGNAGGTGPTLTANVPATPDLQSVSFELPGVIVSSIGGNGGTGGDAFGNFDGERGGAAGFGGTVSVTSDASITTSGIRSHGIFAQSRSGEGGDGGDGFIFGGGGAGGPASAGGPVTVVNNGGITTFGDGGVGIFGQSIGGSAGGGGDSWGLLGSGGNARSGGTGGPVAITNNSSIITSALAAHGILAQSIGGIGGDGGDAGGVVAFGGSGSAGGNGGTAAVLNNATASIRTISAGSHGVLAQSIGGGGGNGGTGGGVAAFGGTGNAGGSGGAVTVTNVAGSTINTEAEGSAGVLAQSIGGGGGDGATSGGLVALGNRGGGAGSGGTVTVNSDASVQTLGVDARGLFAQSIGGGGGNARSSGGLVSIGGGGGSGGSGGVVGLTNGGRVRTDGRGSDAIFAQSIGGGGGSGASSGGAVAIGGGGASGGSGNTVNVTNAGILTTLGARARGIFAQSVGGGGGTGGDGGGLVALGGSGSIASSGGQVTVNNTGAVATQGAQSSALQAQSIGGGGGDGGSSGGVFFTLGGNGGGGGDAGNVTVQNGQNLSAVGNDSNGIFAQSIGGGGGNGGSSTSVSAFAGVAIGGSAGDGGAAGAVNVGLSDFNVDVGGTLVSVAPLIETGGDRAKGIFAQSVGGGGGNGGYAAQVSAGFVAGASAAVGGAGGGGGNGGAVGVTGDSTIVTGGEDADGLLAQSIGGGGGNGGFALSFGASAGPGAGALGIGLGGSGGGGGASGAVTVNGGGNIMTSGALSEGLLAQSVGGGGGNGGYSVAAGIAIGGSGSGAVAVGIGGGGGNGGNAGLVDTTYAGNITTGGAQSDAFIAQSIGGGGGNGGFNVSGTVTGSGGASGAISVGVGGSGGGGGIGGNVLASVTGDIGTTGSESDAIIAQSIGGGGGNGGLNVSGGIAASSGGAAAVTVGIGGAGGSGGNGSTAGLTVNGGLSGPGSVTTTGDDAEAVLVQSVGGGGGNGGMNVSGSVALSKSAGGALAVGVGGSGGSGGSAGVVTGNIGGLVSTTGARSSAVTAQSIGGGGGNGGLNVSGSLNVALGGSGGAVSAGVGGFGGGGGSAGAVTLTRNGMTRTSGLSSHGVIVQSIGGGGGSGGTNISGAISLTNGGNSVAAGLGVGGFGGGSGTAGDVTANVSGDVLADGSGDDIVVIDLTPFGALNPFPDEKWAIPVRPDGSHGILAQSVGGSGGAGGVNVSAGIAVGTPGTTKSFGIAGGVGGFGGGGGDAGAVNLTVDGGGMIRGTGDDRSAVQAQSVGGSGGAGGVNVSGGIALDGAVALGVGGFGGDAGRGSTVNVAVTSDLEATGTSAAGLSAQSIGGGGGAGGINVSGGITPSTLGKTPSLVFGMGGFGGAGSTASDVTVSQTGTIAVTGSRSTGVLAQSIAGGGGNGALNVSANLSGSKSFSVVGGVGGFGGLGANAGAVDVTSDGQITADGRQITDARAPDATILLEQTARGIVAQSIGGGGGNGGMNVAGNLTFRGSPMAVGVGGFGSGGGDSGAVSVTRGAVSQSLLMTSGDNSDGILAQSIAGGGGNAGVNLTGTASAGQGSGSGGSSGRCDGWDPRLLASTCANWANVIDELSGRNNGGKKSKVGTLLVGVGGNGGEAGNASTTSVTHSGNIATDGRNSSGIRAQSIGGGGGNAAINLGLSLVNGLGANIGVGGAPADGGDGNAVTVNHSAGTITTGGDDAAAIYAQSIGGGGGNAELSLVNGYNKAGKINIGLGREGGTGGKGNMVTVSANGSLSTTGDRAGGIFAQSVGNGGGKSGAHSVGAQSGDRASLGLSLGLEGGAGGTSGIVDVTAAGSITTTGEESHAIHAQSVGGGGGVGGMAVAPVILTSTAGVALGGAGGSGGTPGLVTVNNHAMLSTGGKDAHGIFAQSIGGGGGTGGMALGGGLLTGDKAAVVTVGGSGGTGALGNAIAVTNDAAIDTSGAGAFGVNAQSIGGGGGNGGLVVNGLMSVGSKPSTTLSLAVGGTGGTGGAGQRVDVTNTGFIHTRSEQAVGLQAQSIGGGGGNGGMVVNVNVATKEGSQQFGISLGGEGGTGGTSGNVTVDNRPGIAGGGEILTEGESAHGIFAQSVAGGGGNGSAVIAANFTQGKGNLQAGFSLGGTGGMGGTAGTVTVGNAGSIETRGGGAHGVFAQSIGGGGGNGGLSIAGNAVFSKQQSQSFSPLISLGGFGGDGNDAGTVTVNNTGNITTSGAGAHGIVAESIGGGGGDGSIGIGTGTSVEANLLSLVGNLATVLGGNGGTGGLGGEVTVNHSGDITVSGAGAQAIVAQSINGGGGNVVLDFGSIDGSASDAALTLREGAEQVINATPGKVTVNSTGTVTVGGDNAAGYAAQAVGGGGGVTRLAADLSGLAGSGDADPDLSIAFGGMGGNGNAGAAIDGGHDGDIGTNGRNADAVSLQSIGGGGGRGYIDVITGPGAAGIIELFLGGNAGTAEAGGIISHVRTGVIAAAGQTAYGMLAQSIGGGGGSVNLSLTPAVPVLPASIGTPMLQATVPPPATVTLGSAGGTGLDGGAISTTLSGDVTTTGDHAQGLLYQSIGGGGGEARMIGVGSLVANLGGSLGATGTGGSVTIVNTGAVSTQGSASHAVFLQSVGGGGGAVFTDSTDVSVSFSAANAGDGGAISFTQTGDVSTAGAGAFGVFAQSLGGGGGYVDNGLSGSAGGAGTGGTVSLTLDGNVTVSGPGATAVYAQSDGRDGAGNISVSLPGGRSISGGDNGVGLWIDGGADNVFSNAGTTGTSAGADGIAVMAGGGNDFIDNTGTLTGDVDLGAGANSIRNAPGAVLASGATLGLGAAGNVVQNDGTLVPGGTGRALVSNLSGSYVQSANALAMMEIDFATDTLDAIAATGTAQVGGTVDIGLLNPQNIRSGSFSNNLFSGAMGLTNTGLSLATTPSVVIGYALEFPDSATAALAYQVDFSPSGMGAGVTAIGDYIGRVQNAGSSDTLADMITALVSIPDLSTYISALTELSPDFYVAQQGFVLRGSQQFGRSLMNCRGRNGARRAVDENGCMWLRFDSSTLDLDAADDVPAMRYQASQVAAGFEAGAGDWTVGLGFAIDDSSSAGFDGRWSADGRTMQFGALGTRRVGNTLLGMTVSVARAEHDVERRIELADAGQAASARDVEYFGSTIGVAHEFRPGAFSIKPSFEVGVAELIGERVDETGAGGQGLELLRDSETFSWVVPELEIAHDTVFADGTILRPYARAGLLKYVSGNHTHIRADLVGAPAGVEPMDVASPLGRTNELYELGTDLIGAAGVSVQFRYQRRVDGGLDDDNLSVRVSVPLR